MSKAFNEIRLKLDKKEKELQQKSDEFINENIQEIETYIRVIQSKTISLNKLVDSLKSNILRRNQTSLINYFCANNEKILKQSQEEIPNVPDLNFIPHMTVNINKESLEKMIDSLNGIHIEILSIKGMEVKEIVNPNKYSMRRELYGSSSLHNSTSSPVNHNSSYLNQSAIKSMKSFSSSSNLIENTKRIKQNNI